MKPSTLPFALITEHGAADIECVDIRHIPMAVGIARERHSPRTCRRSALSVSPTWFTAKTRCAICRRFPSPLLHPTSAEPCAIRRPMPLTLSARGFIWMQTRLSARTPDPLRLSLEAASGHSYPWSAFQQSGKHVGQHKAAHVRCSSTNICYAPYPRQFIQPCAVVLQLLRPLAEQTEKRE